MGTCPSCPNSFAEFCVCNTCGHLTAQKCSMGYICTIYGIGFVSIIGIAIGSYYLCDCYKFCKTEMDALVLSKQISITKEPRITYMPPCKNGDLTFEQDIELDYNQENLPDYK